MAEEAGHRPDDIAHVMQLVRAHDRPRYYAALFAPAAVRDDLFALYGFAAEIARIPNMVSEPALGEIRLRWWSEMLAEASYREGGGDAPALRAAALVIARHKLPLASFESLVEARGADLYSDPPATLTDLEGRLGETESALFQMAAIVSGASGSETAEAAGHAGVAYGMARRLASFAPERARGRAILPLELLAARGLSAEDILAPTPRPGAHEVIGDMLGTARRHLDEARRQMASVPAAARPVFLPLAVVGPLLDRIERLGSAIAEKEAGLSDLESLTRIGWARLRRDAARPERQD
jgi:phytoene synthase